MATSIRDLIQALETAAPYAAGTERQSVDSAGALSELGRALRNLAAAGLELDVNGRRETITRDLADSCNVAGARMNLDRDGRLTRLAGALADVTAVLREETGRDQRWAITIEVASAARVLTTYAAAGDRRRTADLAWTHLTARALIVQALKDSPTVQGRAVLDRAVPRSALPASWPASRTALEALTVISDRLRRSSVELNRRPTLLEVFAVTRAAESTTRYATTAAAALTGQPIPDARPAAAIWYEVRDRLRPFTTAAPLHLADRDLGVWAQRVHSELRREFGLADQIRLIADDGGLKASAVRDLQAMVNEVPAIATHLSIGVQVLADRGELRAIADRLPFREHRLDQFLQRRAVVADRFDVVTVMDRLGDAGKLAAELATTLTHATGPHIGQRQPHLQDANAVLAAETLPDPHAALVQQARDGMNGDPDPIAWARNAGMPEATSHPFETDADLLTARDFHID
jgi:hypothetical protein